MPRSPQEWTAWFGLVGAIATVVALFNNRFAVALASFASVAVIASAAMVTRARRRTRAAGLSVEGMALDSLRLAELGRTVSRDVIVSRAIHRARIAGADLEQWIELTGTARKRVGELAFSIDSDSRDSGEQWRCRGYDLAVDPHAEHPIQPIVGADGLSRKLVVPLAEEVRANGSVHVGIESSSIGCMRDGKDYFFSSLAFDQIPPVDWTIELTFACSTPSYVRQYGVSEGGQPYLRSSVVGATRAGDTCYMVRDRSSPARDTRIFVFYRSERL